VFEGPNNKVRVFITNNFFGVLVDTPHQASFAYSELEFMIGYSPKRHVSNSKVYKANDNVF
jgi:hypothetical protein